MKLNGKVVFITGASGGIGSALVREFALKHHCDVWASDLDAKNLTSLKNECKKYGSEINTLTCDVTDYQSLQNAMDAVLEKQERIDIWINNAGISGMGHFEETDIKAFDHVMNVNFHGVSNGTHVAIKHMTAQARGLIINVASVAGFVPGAYMASYAASKHAVVGFTRSLQTELYFNTSQVKLMLVSPGFADTGIIKQAKEFPFPDWMKWSLSKPETIAKDICRGAMQDKAEIFPTINGKMMRKMYQHFPNLSQASSKLFLTKKFSDIFKNRYQI